MAETHPEIWIVRHGETEWSLSGQHTGRTDLPLTLRGEEKARELGRALGGKEFALVLTSPLARARETCRLAGYGDRAEKCEDLLEWNYGDYEGRKTVDIRKEVPGWTIWDGGAPGGETAEQVAARARSVIERAEAVGGDVACFAHGHFLRVLTATWLGLPPREGRLFTLGTASISVLSYERGWRSLRRWNHQPEGATG
jgi:broad specificity phosphatase PhoE